MNIKDNIMTKINEKNFLEYLDQINNALSKSIIKDDEHIVWNGNFVNGSPQLMCFKGVSLTPHIWLRVITNREWIINAKKYERYCDKKGCIKTDHFLANDNENNLYKIAYKRLLENSKLDGECRLFTGYLNNGKYGMTSFKNKTMQVHVLAMQIFLKGNIPEGKIVRHKCKNKNCFAIEHLELGTSTENMADKIRDQTDSCGERSPNTILNNKIVLDIFSTKGNETAVQRAKDFSKKYDIEITPSMIYRIDDGSTWNHVTKTIKKELNKKVKHELNQKFIKKNYKTIQKKIKANVKIEKKHWLWQRFKDRDGYGLVTILNNQLRAHRASYMAYNKKFIDTDVVVRHMCNIKDCVNPKHLDIGTHKENAADKILAGTAPIGEKNPASTITAYTAKIIYISKILGLEQKVRAELFNISASIISRIERQISWKSITTKIDKTTCINELREFISKNDKCY
jgi:hypothetical protein